MRDPHTNFSAPRRRSNHGFTLIEAVVSISLFSLMILGATLQLRAYEDGQRSITDALILVKTAREFLGEMAQESRRLDKFDPRTVERDPLSYLDAFDVSLSDGYASSALLVNQNNGSASLSTRGFNFLDADEEIAIGAYQGEWQRFMERWFEPLPGDASGRSLLKKRIGRRADQWSVVIVRPASGAYRIIELHLDDNGTTNLRWPICCQ